MKTANDRFLVVKLADLGDALTATPALRALRSSYPAARIDVLVTSAGASALSGLDSIDRILCFEKAQFDRLRPRLRPLAEAISLGLRLRRADYDRVFLFHHLFTSAGQAKYAALLTVIGSPWRGGLSEVKPWYLTESATDRGYGIRHEADYWLDVVGLAGAQPSGASRVEISIDHAARSRAAAILGQQLTSVQARVALYPGSGPYSEGRRWSESGFIQVGRQLAETNAAEIIIVGGRSERALAERISEGIGPCARNLAGKTDLKTLAALLESCQLVIGNDGGVTHLAVAAGAPVLAVFGPTNHVSWGPYPGNRSNPTPSHPPRVAVVRHDLPCSPCMYRGFLPGTPRGCRSHDCLSSIGPDQVVSVARHMLSAGSLRTSHINE